MTVLTLKENELHNRLIVAEFNLGQVEEELRRLDEVNAELVEALTDLVNEIGDGFMPHKLFVDQALAALTKAQGQTALQRLNKAAEDNEEPL